MGKILVVAALTVTYSFAMASGGDDVVVIQSKHKNFFMIKAGRKLVGARVDVLFSNGEVVTRQTLVRRKMIIDFSDVKPGSYTIRVQKNDNVREFEYEKQNK